MTSRGLLGAGANCSGGDHGNGDAGGTHWLRVHLGSGSAVAVGVALTTRGPQVGFDNYETRQWQQTIVVESPSETRRFRQLVGGGDGPPRRRTQADDTDDAATFFSQITGAEQVPENEVMLITNSSAPEQPVSQYGATGFDALALAEAAGTTGTQVDYTRGEPPDGGQFACPSDCSGNGACLTDLGQCMCLVGFSGDTCEVGSLLGGAPPTSLTQPPSTLPTPPPPRYPPFLLSEGESVVSVIASIITMGLTSKAASRPR